MTCKMKIKELLLFFALLLVATGAAAQGGANFSVKQNKISDDEVEVVFTGSIQPGWHVYSPNIPKGGPTPATINLDKCEGAEKSGPLTAKGKEISNFDKLFDMKVSYFENNVTFTQKFKITGDTYNIKGYLEYGACNDKMCMPPTPVEFDYSGKKQNSDKKEEAKDNKETEKDKAANEKDEADKDQKAEENKDNTLTALADTANPAKAMAGDSAQTAAMPYSTAFDANTVKNNPWWQPAIDDLNAFGNSGTQGKSLWWIFLMGLLGGLIALFTPCVWPIIPMTVSFFLKRTKDRKKAIKDAITYGISIVVIYLTLGLAITAIFGANKLNDLATNAVFNIFFFLLLVVFALSFFGWFEIRLPSKWGNAVDDKANSTSGLLSIFLMAFTLALVSFSCTGPIIGFLLVDFATSGSITAPAVGMLGFALALALPFTLFALFPSWLKQAPKSGSWMNTIKVVLGFIELAFSLKFLSVADLAYGWGILDREVFIALWIAIFALLGLYLIGKLRFQSDMVNGDPGPMPVPCIMLGLCSIAFAIYMLPGLWGAPCKAISAFAPPMSTQDFNLYESNEVRAVYTDYDQGMASAKAQGKPVMIDFTGFGCVNCRKMEAAVWTDPQVAQLLTKDYVLISLFVDDKTPLAENVEVDINGQKRTLRTVGDKWSYLQQTKFGAVAQPFYVEVDNDGKPLNGAYVYKEDIPEYVKWLKEGLERYSSK